MEYTYVYRVKNRDLRRIKRFFWENYSNTISSVNELSRFSRIVRKDLSVLHCKQKSDGTWADALRNIILETNFPKFIDPDSVELRSIFSRCKDQDLYSE